MKNGKLTVGSLNTIHAFIREYFNGVAGKMSKEVEYCLAIRSLVRSPRVEVETLGLWSAPSAGSLACSPAETGPLTSLSPHQLPRQALSGVRYQGQYIISSPSPSPLQILRNRPQSLVASGVEGRWRICWEKIRNIRAP